MRNPFFSKSRLAKLSALKLRLPKPRMLEPMLSKAEFYKRAMSAQKLARTALAKWRQRIQLRAEYPWRNDAHISVLHDGDAIYTRLLSCFAQAQSHIFIELYWFESGEVTQRFIDVLRGAVARGVAVYCLFDDIGSFGLTPKDRALMCEAGIQLIFYNPVRARALFQNLRRDHRKVFIVDDAHAFVGGPGVADDFLMRPGQMPWRDVLFELRGPIVQDFIDYFVHFWHKCSGLSLVLPSYQHVSHDSGTGGGYVRAGECSGGEAPSDNKGNAHVNCGAARLVLSFGERRQHIKMNGLKAIRRAEREVWFFTGYFYPSWKLRRALRKAAARGVEVKLILPGHLSDHPLFAEAGRYYYRYLLMHGVKIFEYQPQFWHMKMLLCDGWVSFGSSNLDRWNQRWNLEANVEVSDPQFVKNLRQEFLPDFDRAQAVLPEQWLGRPWWQRLKTYLYYRVSLAVELWLARRKWSTRR